MAKNKTNVRKEPGNQAANADRHVRVKKLKREGKHKNAEEHLTHIPFKLREIMKSKESMKKGSLKAKRQNKSSLLKGKPKDSGSGDIPVPHFRRGKRESVKKYFQRMENAAKHVLFLTNNQVERKPELEAEQQERPADKGKSEKKKEYDKGRLQKFQQKKLDRQEAKMEKQMFVDDVPFGEVTMAPPSLTSKPKKAPNKSQNTSKELLLNSLLGHTVVSTTKPSMAKQRIMEEERQRAVEAYRLMKKQKQLQLQTARTARLEKRKNLQ